MLRCPHGTLAPRRCRCADHRLRRLGGAPGDPAARAAGDESLAARGRTGGAGRARPCRPVAPAEPAGDLDARSPPASARAPWSPRARATRGGPAPAGQPSDAAVVARGCAPLYRQAACRDAMMRFDDPPPGAALERGAAGVRARLLRPAARAEAVGLRAHPDAVPEDEQQYIAWNELRRAILSTTSAPPPRSSCSRRPSAAASPLSSRDGVARSGSCPARRRRRRATARSSRARGSTPPGAR